MYGTGPFLLNLSTPPFNTNVLALFDLFLAYNLHLHWVQWSNKWKSSKGRTETEHLLVEEVESNAVVPLANDVMAEGW